MIADREPADAIRNIAHHNPAAMQFVLIYNEFLQRDQFEDFAKLACHSRFRFYNAASTGEIIGDKLFGDRTALVEFSWLPSRPNKEYA